MLRSAYNPNFPANWTPKDIDAARAVWGAQSAEIKRQVAESIARNKAAQEAERELKNEMQAALAWCRANGNPHTAGEHISAGGTSS